MSFYDEIKASAQAIMDDAKDGNLIAQQVINLHRMHCAVPNDPGARGLCEAAFREWKNAPS
ncbi:hypothetical protein LCGC14_1633990 [marine sediment metagenome]|uniref:Uncharacterized protein n=1 Tax=marine sediment metagenome TaxID=412755 RepID=A0A0F9I1U1_9ZZZZ